LGGFGVASASPERSRAPSPATSSSGSPTPSAVASGIAHGPIVAPRPIRHGSASATPMLRAALAARLERLRAKVGIPGISATILFADGSVWQGSAGLADVVAARPVTGETAFPVASVSKTFTAALILSLVADGRLALDTRVRTYLPTLKISDAITVRQLLDHTSGLRDFFFHPRIDHALLAEPSSVWDAARSLGYVGKPYAKPGTSWHYSNTNYLILGLLAEAVGDGSVAEQLRARFLTPLGLDHTFYQAAEAPKGPAVRSYRFTGTDPKLPAIDLSDGSRIVPFTSVVTAAGAAGSIASTASDLARWARALYGGDALDAASRDAMLADIARTAAYKPGIAYGLGVQSVAIAGHRTLGHSGRYLGARAAIRWLPDEQMAIAVVTNQSRSDVNAIVADLLRLALTPQPDCITCAAIP
ncbi:MAG: serine hydrolase domain-containing protein, partial [Chloroflexota bacterium]